MAENYDLIFGQGASSQYAWSDSDYQNGWQTVGSTPPTAEQFDALQRRADLKAQELNNRLAPIEENDTHDYRQPSNAYVVGDIAYHASLPTGYYLECTGTGGITSAGDLVITSPNVGNTVTDGTVVWTIRKIADTTEATTTTKGLMSAADKTKLNGIANNANNYSLPAATGSTRGGVKIGSNISLSGDTISLAKANVTNALGYTPPTTNTTYSTGTASYSGITKLYTGIGDNTDGTMTQKAIKAIIGTSIPIGAILPFAGNGAVPAGYLLCDGAAVSRTMYPDLFSVIGTTYGAGDGSTTFNVPDYNTAKRFAHGDTVAGTVKAAGLPNITGTARSFDASHGEIKETTGALYTDGKFYAANFTRGNSEVGSLLGIDASRSNPIYGASDTVQPPALTARYIIKAFDGQTPDSALIDITQYANELATKANRQLSNLDTANLACHVVVDSYYDSTTGDWWRKYDDGWVEQGGFSAFSTSGVHIITLLLPFADTSYTAITNITRNTVISGGTDPSADIGGEAFDLTTTTIKCAALINHMGQETSSGGIRWIAFGQGESV